MSNDKMRATIKTAPAVLNLADKAMWVTGWNDCLDALAAQAQEAPSEPEAVAKIGKGPVASFVHLTDAGRALPPGRYNLYTRPAPASAQAAVAGDHLTRRLVEQCRDALAEELSAYDPPITHVKNAHDACVAWLAAPSTQQGGGE